MFPKTPRVLDEPNLEAVRVCPKCGKADRYPSGSCKPCKKSLDKERLAANPEYFKTKNARWISLNADRKKTKTLAWREANKERVRATSAANKAATKEKRAAQWADWYKNNKENVASRTAKRRADSPEVLKALAKKREELNPGLARSYKNNRRAKIAKCGGKLSKGIVAKLLKTQKGLCPCCRKPLGEKYDLDHIMPIALGGSNTDENMQLLRSICNRQKHAKHPVDFMQERGFLL